MPRKHTPTKHTPFQFELVCQEKKRFGSKRQAEQAAENLELENMGLPLHVYQCPKCHGWHLTRRVVSI